MGWASSSSNQAYCFYAVWAPGGPRGVAGRGPVEQGDQTSHAAHPAIRAHKQAVLRRIVDTAREAGADDPETLGQRIFVLCEGATALSK